MSCWCFLIYSKRFTWIFSKGVLSQGFDCIDVARRRLDGVFFDKDAAVCDVFDDAFDDDGVTQADHFATNVDILKNVLRLM